jgi:exodeoxyribonuclease-1
MASYLFYDIETTGLNKAFDQVLQFAAIRTDMELQEIDRHLIWVKLRPDVIPSPLASITHRIAITQSQQGLGEFEAIKQIHQLMNQPGTISLGYNTLSFDDELLRFCFHRNLLPPYTHQYHQGCRRMDMLPITNMYYLYKRDSLNWPEIEGKRSLRLEHLSKINQLATGMAHNALVDVEATVELARRFYRDTKMWRYVTGCFDKEIDRQRIETIPINFHSIACSNRIGLLVSNEFGADNQYQVPVLLLGNSIPYKNQTLWLRLDLPQLSETTPDSIPETTWVIRKKYGELGIVLPPHERYWRYLSPERQALVAENQDWLQSHTQLFHKIICYHREFSYPWIPDLDIEAALYQNGFLSEQEQMLCRQFQSASLPEQIELVTQFDNIALRQLASRLLCRNYPDDLPTMLTQDFKDYWRRVNPPNEADALRDYKNQPRLTPLQALSEITQLRSQTHLDNQQLDLLTELEDYINTQFSVPD